VPTPAVKGADICGCERRDFRDCLIECSSMSRARRAFSVTSSEDPDIPAAARSGQLLRVKGKGVQARGQDTAGDLYLRLMVRVPKDGVEKEAIEKLEQAYGEDVRKDVLL